MHGHPDSGAIPQPFLVGPCCSRKLSDSVFSLQYGCHMEATAADFAQELLLLLRAVITMGVGLTPVAHLLPIQVLLNLAASWAIKTPVLPPPRHG